MTLTLTMLRCPDSVAPETRTVPGGEYSLGRGPDNDWVLADPERHLSKRHCVIAFRSDAWHVAGTSTNGTFLNGETEPLESGPPRRLRDEDRLRLGPYEIEVRLGEAQRAGAARAGASRNLLSDPFGDDPFAPAAPSQSAFERFEAEVGPPSIALPASFDPLVPEPEEERFAGPTQADNSPAYTDAFRPKASSAVLPENWDFEEPLLPPAPSASPAALPPALPPEPPAPASALPVAEARGDALLAAFLRGAGLESAHVDDPVLRMEQLGAAFRAVVAGIRATLIARAEIKSEFRIGQTMIRPRGNNPLKFSADDDDALAALLGAGRRSDMGAEEAVKDALADIRVHELATVAAMQSAARDLVARLAPGPLRAAAEAAGGLKLPGAGKARAWEAFEALHGQIARGLSDDFDSVFGKSFARAYEQAMRELSTQERRR